MRNAPPHPPRANLNPSGVGGSGYGNIGSGWNGRDARERDREKERDGGRDSARHYNAGGGSGGGGRDSGRDQPRDHGRDQGRDQSRDKRDRDYNDSYSNEQRSSNPNPLSSSSSSAIPAAATTRVIDLPLYDKQLVKSLAWSPCGRYLSTAGADKLIRIWDANSLLSNSSNNQRGDQSIRLIKELKGHLKEVDVVCWAPLLQNQSNSVDGSSTSTSSSSNSANSGKNKKQGTKNNNNNPTLLATTSSDKKLLFW